MADEMRVLQVRIPKQLVKAFRLWCIRHDISMTDEIRRLIVERLEADDD